MKNEKILVVEFEENSLNTLLQTLQTEGFQVVTAKDGHEGLLMFESENPDLVILEPMLLKLHGFDLCRKISKDSNKKTPVIITTGFYKGEHYKTEALDTFGAAAFFEKPYKDEELLTTIQQLLGNGTEESAKNIKKKVKEKKAAAIDIEESVREMEKSIREEEPAPPEQNKDSAKRNKSGKSPITSEVDEMLQDALSDFGLNIDNKPSLKKGKSVPAREDTSKEEVRIEEAIKEESLVIQDETPELDLSMDTGEESQEVDEQDEEKELKTEELIEELIQKEEEIEEKIEEKTEERIEEETKEEAQPEVIVSEQEPEEKTGIKQEETPEETREDNKGEGVEADENIFEEYFEEPEKAPAKKNLFGFLKKIKKSVPIMIGSTAFVVLVAAGATYYFLKPNKAQSLPNQKAMQTTSNVERSTSASEQQEFSPSAPASQEDNSRSELTGGPALEGVAGDPGERDGLDDETIGTVMEPESTTEFMSTTGLSSSQRQVMLPESSPAPESRQFEIVEVKETDEEELGLSTVEISSPQLQEAVKGIMQSENTADRIKTGDLLPIDSVDVPPVATKKINPKYPPAAYRQGLEETVVFRALISEFGNVLDVAFLDPTKTAPAFKKVCDEAVRQWRFTPAKKNGVNVKVWKTFSITFKKNNTE